jgi:2-dehydropantoate 2-reductase
MRFVIVGPGALGSVFAVGLARGGHDVTLLGRASPHLRAMQSGGLHFAGRDGHVERFPVNVSDDPAAVATADVIIVLVKTGDTAAAMRAIAPFVGPEQLVLTLQNGLGNGPRIQSELEDGPTILVGVTSQAATRVGPGSVRHAGEGPTLIGYEDLEVAPRAAELAGIFSAAGLPAAAVPDIERWVWQKAAVNAAINGLTALGEFRNGAIADDPELLAAAEIVAEEASSVARALGIELGGMRGVLVATATGTAENRSSMLQDLDRGSATEVDAIHGAILAAGRETGTATPAIEVLTALIRAKERTRDETESTGE